MFNIFRITETLFKCCLLEHAKGILSQRDILLDLAHFYFLQIMKKHKLKGIA